ncbi:hypothetical protein CRG98_046526, partial [Punica granatum]
ANPLPDHRPNPGSSINMISVCVSERDEEAQENLPPFVINYTSEELTVGFTGHVASLAPFVVDVPLRSRIQSARWSRKWPNPQPTSHCLPSSSARNLTERPSSGY